MQIVIPDLYASAPERLSFAPWVEIRAFLLRRRQSNLLIYNVGTLAKDARAIEELGGISGHYLNIGMRPRSEATRRPRPSRPRSSAMRTSATRCRRRSPSPGPSPSAT